MIKTAIWKPDTCRCVIEYSWDSDDGPPAVMGPDTDGDVESQPHVSVKVTPCDDHASIPKDSLFAKKDLPGPRGDNFKKNDIFRLAIENIPSMTVEVMGEDGEPKQVQRIHRFLYRFDSNRNLEWEVDAGLEQERKHLEDEVKKRHPNAVRLRKADFAS